MRTTFALGLIAGSAYCGHGIATAQVAPQPDPPIATACTDAHPCVEPSFDCLAAISPVEQMICADPELRALDLGISRLYATAKHSMLGGMIQWSQERWLRDRDACTTSQCLRESLQARLWELWLTPQGDEPTYLSSDGDSLMSIMQLGQGWYVFAGRGNYRESASGNNGPAGVFRMVAGRGEVTDAWGECSFDLFQLANDRWQITKRDLPGSSGCSHREAAVDGIYERLVP